jgi:hypothetical protein
MVVDEQDPEWPFVRGVRLSRPARQRTLFVVSYRHRV